MTRLNKKAIGFLLISLVFSSLYFYIRSINSSSGTQNKIEEPSSFEKNDVEKAEGIAPGENKLLSIHEKIETFIYLVFDTTNQLDPVENESLVNEVIKQSLIKKLNLLLQNVEEESLFSITEVNLFEGEKNKFIVEYMGKLLDKKENNTNSFVFYMLVDTDGKQVIDYQILNTFELNQ